MKLLEHINHALGAPFDDSDAAAFTGGACMLFINPFIGWLMNVLTAVIVAFLSRLLWEFAKPFVAWLTGRYKVKNFTDVSIDKNDNIFDDNNQDKP